MDESKEAHVFPTHRYQYTSTPLNKPPALCKDIRIVDSVRIMKDCPFRLGLAPPSPCDNISTFNGARAPAMAIDPVVATVPRSLVNIIGHQTGSIAGCEHTKERAKKNIYGCFYIETSNFRSSDIGMLRGKGTT